MKLIYLEWEDAVANSAWMTEEKAMKWSKETKMIVKQVGWVLEENKRYITLVGRGSQWDDDEFNNEYGQFEKIPKTWIRKRKTINL